MRCWFAPKDQIDNKWALVHVMTWQWTCDKLLPDPMLIVELNGWYFADDIFDCIFKTAILIHMSPKFVLNGAISHDNLVHRVSMTWRHRVCTPPKISLATLQSVDQRGARIYCNGQNIVNIISVYFQCGTIKMRYMRNADQMKMGKYIAEIYYAACYVMWAFW